MLTLTFELHLDSVRVHQCANVGLSNSKVSAWTH